MQYTQAHVDGLNNEIKRLKAEMAERTPARKFAVYREGLYGPVLVSDHAAEWEAHRERYALQDAADLRGQYVRYFVLPFGA